LRLKPTPYRIAEAWALQYGADSFDVLGMMRLVDYQNGIHAVLPIALTVMLVLQYRFHVARSALQLLRFANLAAMPAYGVFWGVARRRLTARALRRYRYERAERDVFAPVRKLARRLPQQVQPGLLDRFRTGWQRVADFPAPRLAT